MPLGLWCDYMDHVHLIVQKSFRHHNPVRTSQVPRYVIFPSQNLKNLTEQGSKNTNSRSRKIFESDSSIGGLEMLAELV